VFGRKKPRKNYLNGAKRRHHFVIWHRLALGFYVIAGMAALMAASCLFVFVYDVLTQCDYFKAASLKIDGIQRLTQKEIVEQAGLSKGMNVLAVNLSVVRKRLMAHPWIAEAEVRREIPAGLFIRIKEHFPLAIVDLGKKYIINEQGRIFKEWTAADPDTLPLISGLQLADITIYNKTAMAAPQPPAMQKGRPQSAAAGQLPFEAVMQVLTLGKEARSILPNQKIRHIRVDRQIGITVEAFNQIKTIVLGYHNYPLKYSMLKNIMTYRNRGRGFPDFNRIDLNNINRIVLNPVNDAIPSGDHKEV
jgi:cell division protein FtsQ